MLVKKLILAMSLLLLTNLSWAEVKASLNQTMIYAGESVELSIESDTKSSGTPDLSALIQHFQIKGMSQRMSSNMLNGRTSFNQTWTVTLYPKHQGEITIPAIPVGSESTLPIQLMVAETTRQIQTKGQEAVVLEAIVGIGKTLPFVQQQIPFTLKLYTDASITEGEIYQPQVDNAVIERLSKDKQYTITREGKRWNILERRYVIFPEKSGSLLIPAALFKGKQRQAVNQQTSPSGGFFNDPFANDPFFGNLFSPPGKPISRRSKPVEIAVQAIPSVYSGNSWLPAEALSIKDSWDVDPPTFKVGEPVERILTLHAKGLTSSQIPELTLSEPTQIRIYPGQADRQTKTDGSAVFGVLKQKISYIPDVEGKVTIPAIQIDWWNINSNEQKALIVPEKVIHIRKGQNSVAKQPPAAIHEPDSTQSNTINTESKETSASVSNDKADNPRQGFLASMTTPLTQAYGSLVKNYGEWLVWAISGLLILGFISVIPYLWRRLQKYKQNKAKVLATDNELSVSKKQLKEHSRQLYRKLHQACDSNDKESAATLLLQLAGIAWPDHAPKNLGALADNLAQGVEEVRELDRNLYAKNSQGWVGQPLWVAVKKGLKPKVNVSSPVEGAEDGIMIRLYPDRLSN